MATGMFIAFEGIDGSGKTTLSNRVAAALRERGLTVEHAREGGWFASRVTQSIRDLCRDARNLALVPRAELLLYVAREIQLVEEVVIPALGRADVVIADRYLYTAEVLARQVRRLPETAVRRIIDDAAAGVWPDMVVLVDVDPSVARGRRKVAKLLTLEQRPASRKGLAGSGLGQRLRDGYLSLAAADPGRWIVVDNTDSDLDELVDAICDIVTKARSLGVEAAVARAHAARAGGVAAPAAGAPATAITTPEAALAAFLGWVDDRARREPTLAAYVLAGLSGAGVDERRLALAARVPRVIARGLRGLSDAVSWRLRRSLVEAAPNEVAISLMAQAAEATPAWALRELLAEIAPVEVAASLQGLDDETAWALRELLYERVPEAVLASLALLDGPRAWQWRERWIREHGTLETAVTGYVNARAAARSITGLDGERAWAIRRAARAAAPVPAIASLVGLSSDRAWRWRDRMLGRAPKTVLSTIAGLDDGRAWAMRVAMASNCREALDSLLGLDHPTAWDLRDTYLELWPSCAVKSMGVLVNGARGKDLLRRALELFPGNISLLKQAAGVATGSNLHPTVMAA
ncbi:MAG TPA: dTMP kinase [Polyangia bacterium]|nr:dTMP kinase [Polyangia bacterium]